MSHANRNWARWHMPTTPDADMLAYARSLKAQKGVDLKGKPLSEKRGEMDERKFDFNGLNDYLAAGRELSAARRELLRAAARFKAALATVQDGELWGAEFDSFESFARAYMDSTVVDALTSLIPPPPPTDIPAPLRSQGDIDSFVEYDREPRRRQVQDAPKRKSKRAAKVG